MGQMFCGYTLLHRSLSRFSFRHSPAGIHTVVLATIKIQLAVS